MPPSRLPEEKLKYLCDIGWLEEQYLKKGMTDQGVGKLLGVCRSTARKYRSLLNIKNISKRGLRGPRKSRLPEDKLKYLHDKEWLEEQYLEKRMTDQGVAEFLGVCQDTARRYRSLSNIKIKRGPHKSIDANWYTTDPYLCYLIGFIFADGYLGKSGLQVGLHKRDIDLLIEFKERYGGTIWQSKNQRNTNVALWQLGRQRLVNYLVDNWGMTPGPKSLNMPPMPNLNAKLMPHFIRGYFDGDGSISFDKYNYLRLTIVSGDPQFLSALNDALPIQCAIYEYLGRPNQLGTWGKKAKSLLKWMWADGQGFHLQRKWKGY